MRMVLAALALLLITPSPAYAQAASAQTTHLQTARTTLHAIFIDTGGLAHGVSEAFSLLSPQFHAQWAQAQFCRDLTPARRRAFDNYFANLAPVAVEVVTPTLPLLVDRYAPQLAEIFSETELNDITLYMRTEGGGSLFRRGVVAGVRNAPPPEMSLAEQEESARFEQTAGGRAWNARADQFNALLAAMARDVIIASQASLRARMARDLCALLQNECTPALRELGRDV